MIYRRGKCAICHTRSQDYHSGPGWRCSRGQDESWQNNPSQNDDRDTAGNTPDLDILSKKRIISQWSLNCACTNISPIVVWFIMFTFLYLHSIIYFTSNILHVNNNNAYISFTVKNIFSARLYNMCALINKAKICNTYLKSPLYVFQYRQCCMWL